MAPGRRSQCDHQGQTYCQQSGVVPEVLSQLRESYAPRICEQHPNKRDLGNDLRRMGVRVDLHELEASAQDEADGHEEDRRRDCRRPPRDNSPDEYRRKDQ